MTNEELIRLQNVQYLILEEIARICNKHEIQYYLAYGTLLGAVRHKGSIPWDFDIDLFMDSENFEKFEHYSNELNECYAFLPLGSAWNGLSRVYKKNTLLYDPSHGRDHAFPIHIDIFRLEYAKPYNRIMKKIVTVLSRYLLIAKLSPYEKGWLFDRFRNNILKLTIVKSGNIISHFFSEETIEKWVHSMVVSDNIQSDYVTIQDITNRYPVKWFGYGSTLPYETSEFSVPENFCAFLEAQYGDFMQFPPEEERFTYSMSNLIIDF